MQENDRSGGKKGKSKRGGGKSRKETTIFYKMERNAKENWNGEDRREILKNVVLSWVRG